MAAPLPWQNSISRGGYVEHLKRQQQFTRQLYGILLDASEEARRAVQAVVGSNRIGAQVRAAQYGSSRFQIQRELNKLWQEIEGTISAGAEATAQAALNMNAEFLLHLTQDLPEAWAEMFLETASRQGELIAARYLNDIPLSPRVYRNEALSRGIVDREVNRGIALSRSAREIAQSVATLINPNTPGGISYAAMRLGRTELNNAFHATTIRTTVDQPWVTAYKWNLSGSHPRPDVCDSYAEGNPDNLGAGVFSKESVPGKPHPHCLCFLAVVQESERTFARNALNGKYDSFLVRGGLAA